MLRCIGLADVEAVRDRESEEAPALVAPGKAERQGDHAENSRRCAAHVRLPSRPEAHCLNFTALNSPCLKAAHPHARWFLVLCIAPDTWNQLSGNAFRTSAGRVECVMRDKYRERAAECLRVANDVNNPDQRTTLLDMALAWMRLADQAERNSRSDVSYETPPRSVSQPTQQQQQRRTSDDSD